MIVVYNDGKGRDQSFEAVYTDKDLLGFPLLPFLTGYGADEDEAVIDLGNKTEAFLNMVDAVTNEVVERRRGTSNLGNQ